MTGDHDPGAGARRWVLLAGVAALVVAGVGVAGVARSRSPGDASAEAGFVRDMSVHHAQAVEMAELVRPVTRDATLRAFATDVVLTQQAQIGEMRGWLDQWGVPVAGKEPAMAWMGHTTRGAMPGMATRAQVDAIRTASPADAETRFLQAMIPHHQGAVLMSRAVLARTDRPEVRRLAQAIIAAQRSEITAMRSMLDARGASTETPEVTMAGVDDPGGHREGGFTGSIRPALDEAGRSLPLAALLVAGVWLLGADPDTAVRRRRLDLVAAAVLAAAGVLHLALAPEHVAESRLFGAFFLAAAVAELALAARLVAAPAPSERGGAAAVAVVLVAVYFLFRLVSPPGGARPETFEIVGVTTQLLQVGAAGALGSLLWRARRGEARIPRLARGSEPA